MTDMERSRFRLCHLAVSLLFALALLAPVQAIARPAADSASQQIYIIELQDPALPSYRGEKLSVPMQDGRSRLQATNPESRGAKTLKSTTPDALEYYNYLELRHIDFESEAAAKLTRQVRPDRRYHFAINGMAVRLTAAEAEILAESPLVKSIQPERIHKLQTDAGPEWIGADQVWNGQTGGNGATSGEGVVVGIIDSGINWDHPSFSDPAPDGFNHTNPYGQQLGLCSLGEVNCNDKLVGVFDFVDDNPNTSVVEENTNGRDNTGHGSHVAGIAVGNRAVVQFGDGDVTEISGVAPHANFIAYRVCYAGEDPGDGSCQGSAIFDAIDQAIEDGVDVINYSIGTNAFTPWAGGSIPQAFLNARNAGIVVVTSAGNGGPGDSTIGSPANAPWILSIGNSSHNRILGSVIENLSGGSAPSPGDLFGASLTGGINVRPIVHAADFGFPLCGVGTPELQADCDTNTGASNPWAGNPVFNGQIVVCDRGEYGRVEKGKNLQLAGAGGMILANTNDQGESIVADQHCLPATHIGADDGNQLRNWLNNGTGHEGSISGFGLVESPDFGDRLSAGSSRGPGEPPVEDVLKPDMISPGTDVLSAWDEGEEFQLLSGTSMSSPHVAGAAALLKALHPDWTPSQISSAIQTTTTPEIATNEQGDPATPHEVGGGRPQLGDAADVGLFLDVTTSNFNSANPSGGGDPKSLNLFGLVDSQCRGICDFTRTVTDLAGGANWQVTAMDFPAAAEITVTPSSFSLTDGGSQTLNIEADLRQTGLVGQWVYGRIELSSPGRPDQYLTVALFYRGGDLPEQWAINSDLNAGQVDQTFSGLVALPDATFTSGGFVRPTITTEVIVQDPTVGDPVPENEDPFDGGEGTFTVWHDVPEGALWLHAETLGSTSNDLDLFVGRDTNNNGQTEESELICQSISPVDIELCDILTPEPGSYWIIVQNWAAGNQQGDEATLVSAVIDDDSNSDMVVSGPGIIGENETFTLDLGWNNVDALQGERLFGAVGLGTSRSTPNNVGVIPVVFNRNGIADPETTALMPGSERRFALDNNANHDRLYVDIPAGITSMMVNVSGRGSTQSNNLTLDLYREDFSTALGTPPFVQLPQSAGLVDSANGSGGEGPALAISNGVTPGRYYLDVSNTRNNDASVAVSVTVETDSSVLSPHKGLWDFQRSISQGGEWNSFGDNSFLVWYAYDRDGQPTWYIAAGPSPQGNVWVADLLRVTNDGAMQQEQVVGTISMTFVANDEVIMSYSLLGSSGFDPMRPNGANTCPNVGGGQQSYTGHWYRGVDGLGGATVLNYASAQAQVHYHYDSWGVPRWVIAADGANPSGTATEIPLLQFEGFCATCEESAVEFSTVGLVTRSFDNETSGEWTLNFVLDPPLSQSINRTDSVVKLSETLACE